MSITTKNHELVLSGSIIQIDNSPISIVLKDRIEGDYTIIFEFITDPNQRTVTKMEELDKFIMKIVFINFDGRMNIGNKEPLYLGTLEKKNLFLVYRVDDLVGSGKTIHYSFYVERRNTNG